MYQIQAERRVLKDLDNIPVKDLDKINHAIFLLEHNPRSSGVKKLKGPDGLYRIRQGDYRIVYYINDHSKIVQIIAINHRKDVYRGR